jgi:hypothetical protein
MTLESLDDSFGLMSEADYAKLTDRDIAAIRNERSKGRGPAFVRLGRVVKYPRKAVADYIAAQTVTPGKADAPTLIDGDRRRGTRSAQAA